MIQLVGYRDCLRLAMEAGQFLYERDDALTLMAFVSADIRIDAFREGTQHDVAVRFAAIERDLVWVSGVLVVARLRVERVSRPTGRTPSALAVPITAT